MCAVARTMLDATQVMTYMAMGFHDLCRTAVRNLVAAGMPEKVAQTITDDRTRSTLDRHQIVLQQDVSEAGRDLAVFDEAEVRGQLAECRRFGKTDSLTFNNIGA